VIITYVENHSGLFTALAAIVTILGVVGGWIIAYYRRHRGSERLPARSRPEGPEARALARKHSAQIVRDTRSGVDMQLGSKARRLELDVATLNLGLEDKADFMEVYADEMEVQADELHRLSGG
jgi:hypothetical protein